MRLQSPLRTRGAPARAKPKADKRHRQDKPLTPAQELFIGRYMVRMNATRAYLDTHPAASYATARVEGSRLRRDPRVAREIEQLVADAKCRLRRSADRALDEVAALAFSSISDVFDASGAIIPPNELPRDVAVAVKEVERREILGPIDEETGRRKILGHTITLKMHDKVGPLKLLGQHFGVFVERVEVTGKDFATLLKEARERTIAARHGDQQPQNVEQTRLDGPQG